MGFVEDVRAKIDENLALKITTAEEDLKKFKSTKEESIDGAATNKLELLVLRRTPVGPGNPERLAKESALQTKIRDAREKYNKADQENDSVRKDLHMYQGIKGDLQKGALQLIA